MIRPGRLLPALAALVTVAGCQALGDSLVDTGRWTLRAMADVETGSVVTDAGDIAYFLRAADGPTLVLLHGFASEKDAWLRFMRGLPDEYRILALDLPGHGASTRDPQTNYSVETMVRSVETVVAELNDGPVHVVGTSLGGMIATLFTARNPQRVRTLSLYAPAGVYPPNPSEFQRLLEQGENPLIASTPDEFDRLIELVFFDPPPMMWPVGSFLRGYALSRADFHRKIWNDLWPDHPTLDPFLPDIAVPVLLVWGTEDRILDVSSVTVFGRLLPRVETVLIDDLGHATVNERPADLARLQTDFLTRHVTPVTAAGP